MDASHPNLGLVMVAGQVRGEGAFLSAGGHNIVDPYGETAKLWSVNWHPLAQNTTCANFDGSIPNSFETCCQGSVRSWGAGSVLDANGLSAEVSTGYRLSFDGVGTTFWADEAVLVQWNGPVDPWLDETVLAQVGNEDNWLTENVTATWNADGTGWNSLAVLNENRHVLKGKLDQLQLLVGAGASIPARTVHKRDWAQDLEDYVSRELAACQLSSVSSTLVFTNQEKLVFTSLVDHLSSFFERVWSYALILRYATLLVHSSLHSRKGLADIVGIFVNERSWYLHHSAHPPEASATAVQGRLPASTRRACFRPQPA